jgi:hypothetical protein
MMVYQKTTSMLFLFFNDGLPKTTFMLYVFNDVLPRSIFSSDFVEHGEGQLAKVGGVEQGVVGLTRTRSHFKRSLEKKKQTKT